MLSGLMDAVPELNMLANLEMAIPFNKDSCRVGPREWVQLARLLHRNRANYDAFVVCPLMLVVLHPDLHVLGSASLMISRRSQGDWRSTHLLAEENCTITLLAGCSWHGHTGIHCVCALPHVGRLPQANCDHRWAA